MYYIYYVMQRIEVPIILLYISRGKWEMIWAKREYSQCEASRNHKDFHLNNLFRSLYLICSVLFLDLALSKNQILHESGGRNFPKGGEVKILSKVNYKLWGNSKMYVKFYQYDNTIREYFPPKLWKYVACFFPFFCKLRRW